MTCFVDKRHCQYFQNEIVLEHYRWTETRQSNQEVALEYTLKAFDGNTLGSETKIVN